MRQSSASLTCHFLSLFCRRPREAIECLKRALIGADPLETTIHIRLAKLYYDMADMKEATNYHRHIVELCMSASQYTRSSAPIISPSSHPLLPSDKPVIEYARSAVQVARYHLHLGGGDYELAKRYMEKVATSNAEEVREATDLLKKARTLLNAKQLAESKASELVGAAGPGAA